jgi:phosphatidylglycerophosphate synthase
MKKILDNLELFLKSLDHYKDELLFLFIKPYWPRKIIPNHITYVRVFLGILLFILLFFFRVEDKLLVISLFCIGVLTDLIDGAVARGLDKVTEFGAMLDSTADRIIILPIAVYSLYESHKWLLLLLLLWEVINALTSMFYKSKEIYLESNIYGKTKMVLLSVVFAVILITWPNNPPIFFIYLLWFSMVFSFLSIFERIIELNEKGHIKNKIIKKELNKYEEKSKNL